MNANKTFLIRVHSRLFAAVIFFGVLALAQQPPYHDARKNPPVYAGPGRDDPEPADLQEVRFGWFGPPTGSMWDAANRAIDESNKGGGYKGLPFRLVPRWSDNPWRAGASNLAHMVYDDRVWAILAASDGAAAHLAEQVAAKALLPLVNTVATDRSIHTAGVPLAFSCVQGDNLIAPVIAGAVADRSVVLISSTDHDSRAFLQQLKPKLVHIVRQIEIGTGPLPLAAIAAEAVETKADAVVVVAGPLDSALLVKALRAARFAGTIVGGPATAREEFLKQAGPAAEGSLLPLLSAQQQFPDYAAACAHDSVLLLVAAARKEGLNRARIVEALKALAPFEGASGRIEWDEFGENRREVRLGTVRGSRITDVVGSR